MLRTYAAAHHLLFICPRPHPCSCACTMRATFCILGTDSQRRHIICSGSTDRQRTARLNFQGNQAVHLVPVVSIQPGESVEMPEKARHVVRCRSRGCRRWCSWGGTPPSPLCAPRACCRLRPSRRSSPKRSAEPPCPSGGGVARSWPCGGAPARRLRRHSGNVAWPLPWTLADMTEKYVAVEVS